MEDTHVGFTGTQDGMSQGQKNEFRKEFTTLVRMAERQGTKIHFHHGDCMGADANAHDIVQNIKYTFPFVVLIYVHPPLDGRKRAYRQGDFMMPTKPYIERNHDIVDACSLLFVTPKTNVEEIRSGTWATYRYAMKKGVPVYMVSR